MGGPHRAVFLDRDGVLNRAVPTPIGGERPPWNTQELEVLPGVVSACAALRERGLLLVIVTNQPDIASGRVAAAAVDAIDETLVELLEIDAVYVCPHSSGAGCACRKPRPGMLLDAASDHSIDLAASWLVGDRWVDIAAGRAAGVRTALISRAMSWNPTSAGAPPPDLLADLCVASLSEAVQGIVAGGATAR
jgi:D-glycero-D-manno-heptose 1,7-bisphosphate phosphatase